MSLDSVAIISDVAHSKRQEVGKLTFEGWGVAITEIVRRMDGVVRPPICMVCIQFQWDCIGTESS